MGLSRQLLLAMSESPWLRANAPRWWIVRKAATRFMPGVQFEDAIAAAWILHAQNIGVVFTELGENLREAAEGDVVTGHYVDVVTALRNSPLDGQISVKLTQLGLDADEERCFNNVRTLAQVADRSNMRVWIDMEQHRYVDRTLMIYRRLLSGFGNVGVCLQAYLHRTREDLQALLPLGGGIRLVKGAYREPPDIAFPSKRDVDENFAALAALMLAERAARGEGRHGRMVFGTHDRRMVSAIQHMAREKGLPADAFEFHLLFGIQRAEQLRLVRSGCRVRVLISYGEQWFAWYMRRLAERPANVLFAARAFFSWGSDPLTFFVTGSDPVRFQ
jgi:proline dehydrogenase